MKDVLIIIFFIKTDVFINVLILFLIVFIVEITIINIVNNVRWDMRIHLANVLIYKIKKNNLYYVMYIIHIVKFVIMRT